MGQMGQISHTSNEAGFRVTLDGTDFTSRMRPRLISLSLTEKRGDEADQLDLVFDDAAGDVALPRMGVALTLQLGWLRGSDVQPGLIDKGSFIVDEVAHEGPPDTVVIRARAADFTGEIRTRREGSWHASTIGAVIADVAGRNRLRPRCAAALAGIAVPSLAQSRESDIALLRRLGREQDAVATIKAGTLIFAPIGAGQTAGGQALPGAITLRRNEGDRHRFTIEKRDEANAVEADWHDRDAVEKKTVRAGSGSKVRKLSRTYASQAAAKKAVASEQARSARAPMKFEFEGLGRPGLYPERAVRLSGFKAAIDAIDWRVTEVRHSLSKDGGFRTNVLLESAASVRNDL